MGLLHPLQRLDDGFRAHPIRGTIRLFAVLVLLGMLVLLLDPEAAAEFHQVLLFILGCAGFAFAAGGIACLPVRSARIIVKICSALMVVVCVLLLGILLYAYHAGLDPDRMPLLLRSAQVGIRGVLLLFALSGVSGWVVYSRRRKVGDR